MYYSVLEVSKVSTNRMYTLITLVLQWISRTETKKEWFPLKPEVELRAKHCTHKNFIIRSGACLITDGISTTVLNVKTIRRKNVHLVRFAALILLYVYLRLGYMLIWLRLKRTFEDILRRVQFIVLTYFASHAIGVIILIYFFSSRGIWIPFYGQGVNVDGYILQDVHLLFLLLLFPAVVEGKTLDS